MVGGVAGRRCGGPRVMAVSMGVSDDECVHRTLPTTGRSARGDRGSRAEAWAGGKYVGIYRPLVDLLAAYRPGGTVKQAGTSGRVAVGGVTNMEALQLRPGARIRVRSDYADLVRPQIFTVARVTVTGDGLIIITVEGPRFVPSAVQRAA